MTSDLTALPPPERAAPKPTLRREIFVLAWPAVLELVLNMLSWMAGVAMVGRLGANALSATGFSGQIFWAAIFFTGGIGVAVTAIVSRRVGAGDPAAAGREGAQGILPALGAGLVIGAGLYFVAPGIFHLTNLGPEASSIGVTYLRTLCVGAPILTTTMAMSGILRGFGDTRTPMVISVVSIILGIATGYALIFGRFGLPALGARGAALANVGGEAVALLLTVLVAFGGGHRAGLRAAWMFRVEKRVLSSIVGLGLPASLESFFIDLGRAAGMFAVASLGALAVAGHEVTAVTESLSFMPGYGFAMATTILVGQSLGAGDPVKAKAAVAATARLSVLLMGLMAVLFLLFPRVLVSIFTNDPEIIDLAARCLRVAAFAQPFIALEGVYAGALRGAGDTRSPMLVSGTVSWGCRVALTYVAVFVLHLPLPWVWGVMVLDWGLKALFLYLVFKRGRWQVIKV